MKKIDVDVDEGQLGIAQQGGQMATVVPVNKKCSGCLHYEVGQMMCLSGLAPRSCGSGVDPEKGYAPMMPDSQAYQEWRQKMGLQYTAPTAQAGKKGKDSKKSKNSPSYSVEVLGDSKVRKSIEMQWYENSLYPEMKKALGGEFVSHKDAGAEWHNPAGAFANTDKKPSGMQTKNHMDQENWKPGASGRTHSVTTPEGHLFSVLHHEDGTHSVHIQPSGGKRYSLQTTQSKKLGRNAASYPSHEEAIGAAVQHYHQMTGSAAKPSTLTRSFAGLLFFQSEVDNFKLSLSKALSSEPMSFKGHFGYAIPSDGSDSKSYYGFDFHGGQVFYNNNRIAKSVKGDIVKFHEVAMKHHQKTMKSERVELLKGYIAEAVDMYKAVAAHMSFGEAAPQRSVSVMNPTLHSKSDFGEYPAHAHSPGKSVVTFKPHGGDQVEHLAGHSEHGIPHPIPNHMVAGLIAGHHLGKRMAHVASSLASSPKPGFKEQKIASMPLPMNALLKAARIVIKAAAVAGALKTARRVSLSRLS